MVTCTGHIGIHEGADGRTDVRMYVVRTYGRSWRHGYKTKFSHIDGLPYFLNYGAPRASAFGARGAPLIFLLIFESRKISRESGHGENELTNLHTCVEMWYVGRQEFFSLWQMILLVIRGEMTTNDIATIRKPQTHLKRTQVAFRLHRKYEDSCT